MVLLYQLLDRLWDQQYRRYIQTHVTDTHGHLLKEVPTSFSMLLKRLPWLPAQLTDAQLQPDGRVELVEKRELLCGQQLFLHCAVVKSILAHHVPYLAAQSSQKSGFTAFLGIRDTLCLEFISELLVHFGHRGDSDDPRVFFTSVHHMKAVYAYLRDNMPPKMLQEFVQCNPVIFVATGPGDSNRVVRGLLMKTTEVYWAEPSGLFTKYREALGGSHRQTLAQIYQDFEGFFLQCVRVQQEPGLDELADLLVQITRTVPQPRALLDVLQLLTIIGRKLSTAAGGQAAVPDVLKTKPVLPVKGERWAKAEDKPMIADDKNLEDLFKGKEGVFFLDLGEKQGVGQQRRKTGDVEGIEVDAVKSCLVELGIEGISASCSVDYIPENYQLCPSLQRYVHSVIGCIQLCLLSQYEDIYQAWQEEEIRERLSELQCGQVGRLDLVYSLKHKADCVEVLAVKCRLIDGKDFQVHYEYVNSYKDINKELARYFSRGSRHCFRELR